MRTVPVSEGREPRVVFDRDAAIRAARQVLDVAPRVAGDIAVDLGELVDTITAAGSPDALSVPSYDETLAQGARYRIARPGGDDDPGMHSTVTTRGGDVATGVWRGGDFVGGGLTEPDAAWYLGLAYCSAAQQALREERR